METVGRLRAMASLCRQGAGIRHDRSWKLLAEAEYWEHLANAALLEHFQDCTAGVNDQTQPQPNCKRDDMQTFAGRLSTSCERLASVADAAFLDGTANRK
jgi:hypothetical protein